MSLSLFLQNTLLGKYEMQGTSWKLETLVMQNDVVYNGIQDGIKWNWNDRLGLDRQEPLMWWQGFWIVLGNKESLDFTLKQWDDLKTISRNWRKLFLPQTIRQSGSWALFSPSKKCHVIKNDLIIIWVIWSQLLSNFALFVFLEGTSFACWYFTHDSTPPAESIEKSVDKCAEWFRLCIFVLLCLLKNFLKGNSEYVPAE